MCGVCGSACKACAHALATHPPRSYFSPLVHALICDVQSHSSLLARGVWMFFGAGVRSRCQLVQGEGRGLLCPVLLQLGRSPPSHTYLLFVLLDCCLMQSACVTCSALLVRCAHALGCAQRAWFARAQATPFLLAAAACVDSRRAIAFTTYFFRRSVCRYHFAFVPLL